MTVLTPLPLSVLFALTPSTAPVLVDGVPLPRSGDAAPLLSAQAERWLDAEITIDARSLVLSATRRELGARVDVQATLQRVRQAGRSGSALQDLPARVVRGGDNERIEWVVDIDEAVVREFVRGLRDEIEARAEARHAARVAAGETPEAFSRFRSEVSLPLLLAIDTIRSALREGDVYLVLPSRRLGLPEAPAVGQDDRFNEVLASHETEYHGVRQGRRHNIEEAARRIDGTILEPGEEFSFNQALGERTRQNGYRVATEIANGELVDGIGGGICQTAGTLHAAAFLAGLDVAEHHHHSRASSYIDLGLDAMVSWPDKDLRFRNDLPFAIQVSAQARDGIVEVQLRGAQRLRSVTFRTVTVSRTDRRERRVVAEDLAPGTRELVREGEDGYVLERTRVVRTAEGENADVERLVYPPVDRLVRVGG
ncbi:MAG: VanW family protein [Myxococcota bacterium]